MRVSLPQPISLPQCKCFTVARDQPTWNPALWKIRTEKPDSSPFHSYEDHTKGLQFFITRLQPEKIAQKPMLRNITLRNRENLSVFTLRNVLATEKTERHSSHAGMTNGCFRAGEFVITESSSPNVRQMGKKLTRNMLRDALSLSQNWNCGNKYKKGLCICIYIYIFVYITCVTCWSWETDEWQHINDWNSCIKAPLLAIQPSWPARPWESARSSAIFETSNSSNRWNLTHRIHQTGIIIYTPVN